MGLNDDQIRELLRWYVNSSGTREEYHTERLEELQENKKWIDPKIIENMPFEELKEHYINYYNSGTGKKQNINAINRDKIIKNPKFRETILYLFDENVPINERLNDIFKGEMHINGMNRALSTAFLMDYKPQKYVLWNGKTDDGLAVLGWDQGLNVRGESAGNKYLKVLNLFKKLKNLDPQLKLDYMDLDLFLHTIAATDEGKLMVEKINNNSSNLRYFIKKTLTEHNSTKQEDIDEIRDLFERKVPKYLEKIANENLPTNDQIYKAKGGAGNSQINSIDEMSYLPEVQLYWDSKEKNQFDQYYIIYKVREDRKGMYLSLNHSQSFMKGILEAKGEYDGWFKDNFENGLKIEASKARNTLNFKPEGFSESMDLGAKNAKSARMYEAATVYAKYYTLDNLPTEEALISDFKDILQIYKNSQSIGKINIKEPLEIIFKNLPLAKKRNENVKGHQLGKAFTEISKAIFEIAKSIDSEKSYNSVAYYQSKGKWYFKPYIYIEDKANKDIYGHWDQHYVGFWFPEDLEGVTLSLEQSRNYAQNFLKNKLNSNYSEEEYQNYLKYHATQIKNQLNKSLKITDKPLEKSSKLTSNVDIFGKYYNKNNLPSNDEIISDFKELFNLYYQLKPDKDLPSYDGLKIIDNKNEIEQSQKKLESLLKIASVKSIEYSLESSKNNFYLSEFNIWTKSAKTQNFFVNMFGTGNPKNSNETIVEINFSYDGIKNLTSGAFAKDNSGNTFLLHNGKLGGKYVGKSLLEDNYKGKWVDIEEGTIEKKFILIGGLDDPDFLEKLKNFVFNVCKIKKGEECLNNQNFFEYLSEKGYLFDKKIIENFLLSLKVKQFVILTGNSGTGKTKIAQLFAKYLDIQEEKSPKETYTSLISIKRSITTYSQKHNGGWRLKPNEIKDLLKYVDSGNLSELSNNLSLELNINNKVIRGKGIVKEEKQSYSPDPQVYIYYDKDSPLKNELRQVNGEINLHLVKKEFKTILDVRYEIVPVGANWTENRHVVGFYNVITEKYQKTQALDLILKAINDFEDLKDHSSPYFLILDEMNLSHVERYFSDFLSAMESEDPIHLHDNKELKIPKWKIELPINLLVIGTVNVDETTYMFSPKVLDRANTLEFLTLPAEDYMSGSQDYNVNGDVDYLLDPLSDINIRDENINQLKNRLKDVKNGDGNDIWDVLSVNINQFQQILKKADFDFGFRTINEIVRFMYVSWKYDQNNKNPFIWDNWERYFDAQIIQKMLPKLHGSQKELGDVLEELEKNCNKGNFPATAEKLNKMIKTLKEKRYVSFTG